MSESVIDSGLLSVSQSSIRIPDLLSSLLVLSASGPHLGEGLFTNLSVEPSWRWYFSMTPFETIFLSLIIGQLAMLNIFGIMPLNVNTFMHGMPGRKKRGAFEVTNVKSKIGCQLLMLLKKLDPDQCSFKTICELGANSCRNDDIPSGISSMLTSLRFASKKRKELARIQIEEKMSIKKTVPDRKTPGPYELVLDDGVLELYEEALKIGDKNISNRSETVSTCEDHYPRCPLDSKAIMDYVKLVHNLDDLF